MEHRRGLRAAILAVALTLSIGLGARCVFGQSVECADDCLSAYADCLNSDVPDCENTFMQCVEKCIREGQAQ
jgi:hypothetical protein